EPLGPGGAAGAGEQVQVVVAQHAGHAVAELARPAQHIERARSAIDQVADQPQLIDVRLEVDEPEQAVQARHAALDIADRVACHVPLVSHARRPHTAMRVVTTPARHEPIRTSSAPVPRTRYDAQAAWVLPRVPGYAGRLAPVCSPRPQPSR